MLFGLVSVLCATTAIVAVSGVEEEHEHVLSIVTDLHGSDLIAEFESMAPKLRRLCPVGRGRLVLTARSILPGEKDVIEVEFQNGDFDGCYHESIISDGIKSLIVRGKYRDGKREGVFEHFDSGGVLMFSREYQKGILHGFYRRYYASGELFIEKKIVEGRFEGKSSTYLPNGSRIASGVYRQGKPYTGDFYVSRHFEDIGFETGSIIEGSLVRLYFEQYKSGKLDGVVVFAIERGGVVGTEQMEDLEEWMEMMGAEVEEL